MARSLGHFERLGQGADLLADLGDSPLPEMQRLANQEQRKHAHPCEQDHHRPLDGLLDRLAVLVMNRVRRASRWQVVVMDLGQRLVALAEPRALQPLVIAATGKALLTHFGLDHRPVCSGLSLPPANSRSNHEHSTPHSECGRTCPQSYGEPNGGRQVSGPRWSHPGPRSAGGKLDFMYWTGSTSDTVNIIFDVTGYFSH